MYKEFLGISQFYKLFFSHDKCIDYCLKLSHWKVQHCFRREWHEENMEINYVQENPRAVLCHEHTARIRLQLEEILGTCNGYFFVTLYHDPAVQRVSFGCATHSSSFNDVRFCLHILQPYAQPGKEPSNYFNFHTFVMSRRLCYSRNSQCPLHHTELVEYSKTLTIADAITNARNRVHTVGIVDSLSDQRLQFSSSREVMKIRSFQNIDQ